MDKKLTKEELNGLSSRARKLHEEASGMIHETLTINPNAEFNVKEEIKKEKKNEKL